LLGKTKGRLPLAVVIERTLLPGSCPHIVALFLVTNRPRRAVLRSGNYLRNHDPGQWQPRGSRKLGNLPVLTLLGRLKNRSTW
tara:strand:+ start:248 stop:496 length:249 start_codon:yes stop_codon:yes gene_type:complete